MRNIAYTSGASPCGIADYHRRLAEFLPDLETTLPFPTEIVLRDHPIRLWRTRRTYQQLAAAADSYDATLIQMVTTWNGFRFGEFLLPTFVNRLRRPLVVVLHEWPEGPAAAAEGTPFLRRGVEAALRRFDFGDSFESWLQRRFLARVSHFVVHSEQLKGRLLSAGVAVDRVTFCLMPVYPVVEQETLDLSYVPPHARVIVLYGFPHPRKRYDIAVDALSGLPEDVVMLVVGSTSGPFRSDYAQWLVERARTNGTGHRLFFTGEISESALASVLGRASAALSPAGYATGSASLGSLVAAGLPIVASDLPSISAVREGGAGIVTFDSGDVRACIARLTQVLDSRELQTELQERNRRFSAVHTFSRLGAVVTDSLRQTAAPRAFDQTSVELAG